jgi:hypothetical protein
MFRRALLGLGCGTSGAAALVRHGALERHIEPAVRALEARLLGLGRKDLGTERLSAVNTNDVLLLLFGGHGATVTSAERVPALCERS